MVLANQLLDKKAYFLFSDAFEKGWSEAQMMEAVHVACAIRGGASLVHGVQMMNKVKEIAM